jgi:hypothetical protein
MWIIPSRHKGAALLDLNMLPRLTRVAKIKEIFAYDNQAGVKRSDTAKEFGMSFSAVSKLLRGLTHQEDVKLAGVRSSKSNLGAFAWNPHT